MTPSEFLYFPTKGGEWILDSQGKPRVYKSPRMLFKNLKPQDYDHVHVYACDDVLSREEFEEAVTPYDR
jgi:hypothetical protein